MAPRPTALRSKRLDAAAPQLAQPAIGKVMRRVAPRSVWVEFQDRPPVEARAVQSLTEEQLDRAVSLQLTAIVIFEGGEAKRAILLDLIGDDDSAQKPAGLASLQFSAADATTLTATVDGKRVEICADDEIVLKCGKASITLRRNGRVVVRGTHLETDSEGINRIKGSSVKIN